MIVDLNADLAEGFVVDEPLLSLVTSANICCGVHAGGATEIMRALRWAKQAGVRIGAHPSFPDRVNFGRETMQLPDDELIAWLNYQLGALAQLCQVYDVEMDYVKPHGALYNQAAKDEHLASLIVETVYQFNPQLKLMALSGSLLLSMAKQRGLGVISEVFADRRYLSDGTLVPRSRVDAKVKNDDEAVAQVLQMVTEGVVRSVEGVLVPVQADSICLHGDGEHALVFARKIRDALERAGVVVQAVLK